MKIYFVGMYSFILLLNYLKIFINNSLIVQNISTPFAISTNLKFHRYHFY